MNFIDRRHEPMPAGAAQSHEQPMVEKSVADALAARVWQLEFILTGYHTDTKCGSCKGPLEEERDAICKRCTMESDNERLTQENAALRELVEELRKRIKGHDAMFTHCGEHSEGFNDAVEVFAAIINKHLGEA